MKVSLCLLLLLGCFLLCSTAEATPIETGEAFNMAFSGQTCMSCWGTQPLPNVTFQGLLTVAPVIGAQLWDPWYQTYLSSGLIVTGLTGTLSIDCLGVGWCSGQGTYLLSFLQPPLGDGSWLLYTNTPRYLVVSAEGLSPYARFINDNSVNLFQWSSSQVPVTFSTTRVPESLSLVLLSIGLSAVFVVAGRFGRKRNSAAD